MTVTTDTTILVKPDPTFDRALVRFDAITPPLDIEPVSGQGTAWETETSMDHRTVVAAKLSDDRQVQFWAYATGRDDPDGCWEWQAYRNISGYGQFGLSRRLICFSHRIAWALTFGPIPKGLFVLHRCDNPPCINPAHLFLGTVDDNAKDMVAKGRAAVGPRHRSQLYPDKVRRGSQTPIAKVTEDQVREIRQRHAAGETYLSLGQSFGLDFSTVGSIVRRDTWKHVTDEVGAT